MSNFKLNGEYKYTIFDSQKNIKRESDYFSNFITSDGLRFIYFTGFAHNLEYLSLGSSNAANSLSTTGLSSPINDFQYFTGFLKDGVGTQVNHSGLSFYKTWILPSPTSGVSKNYTVREFMVSPASGGDLEDFLLQGTGYFSRAFSRATGLAELVTGDFLSVTYRLNISHDTCIKTFLNVVATGSSNKFTDSYKSFNYFSGIYSLMHPALKVLLPIEGASVQPEGKPGEVKESYVGMGMEPSCPAENLFCYLSEDGAQFLVNPNGAGGGTGSYSLSNGVHKYVYNAPTVLDSINENIRWKNFKTPSTGDIRSNDITAETGIYKNSTSAVIAPPINGIFPYEGTGRERYILRAFGWIGASSPLDLFDYQWKSMVLGYQKSDEPGEIPDGEKITPYTDFLLGTSSGELKPRKTIYNQGTSENPIMKTGWLYNSGDYLQLDNNNNLSLSFKLSWSSPCGDATDCT